MNAAIAEWLKTIVPLAVLTLFIVLGVWSYNAELQVGGYSPKTSQRASKAVIAAIRGAAARCSAEVAVDEKVPLDVVLARDAQQTALCHQALARLDELSASVQGAAEMIAAASEKSYRATAYNRQGALGVVIMMLVFLIVLSGLYFSYLNVVGLSKDNQTKSVLRFGSLRLTSPVVGAIVLVASMGFFYLYLTAVFEMRDSRNPRVLADEVARFREAMNAIDAKSPPSPFLDAIKRSIAKDEEEQEKQEKDKEEQEKQEQDQAEPKGENAGDGTPGEQADGAQG